MNIVFLDRDTVSPQTRLRAPSFKHTLNCHGRTAPVEVAARIAYADIVLVNKVRLDAAAIAAAPRHHRHQHPRLRGEHGAGAHLRIDLRAAPEHLRLP